MGPGWVVVSVVCFPGRVVGTETVETRVVVVGLGLYCNSVVVKFSGLGLYCTSVVVEVSGLGLYDSVVVEVSGLGLYDAVVVEVSGLGLYDSVVVEVSGFGLYCDSVVVGVTGLGTYVVEFEYGGPPQRPLYLNTAAVLSVWGPLSKKNKKRRISPSPSYNPTPTKLQLASRNLSGLKERRQKTYGCPSGHRPKQS